MGGLRLRSSPAYPFVTIADREVVAMKHLRSFSLCIAAGVCLIAGAAAQTQNGEWRSYGGDPGSTKYAPLDQIDRTNVRNLRIAWRRPAVDPLLSGKDPKLQA